MLSQSHWSQKVGLDLWGDSGNCNKPTFLFSENIKCDCCHVIKKAEDRRQSWMSEEGGREKGERLGIHVVGQEQKREEVRKGRR